jgi:hypothetical protein
MGRTTLRVGTCSSVGARRRLGRTSIFRLEDYDRRTTSKNQAGSWDLHNGFLLEVVLCTEDGDVTFISSVRGIYLTAGTYHPEYRPIQTKLKFSFVFLNSFH